MLKRAFFLISFFVVTCALATSAMAATSVVWTAPADGSSYVEGTIVNPQGTASASGITGGTGLDLMLVIDTSASMQSLDKIGYAKDAAVALINSLPNNTTQVGIVTFDISTNTYRTLQDLTANKTDLINAVNALNAPGAATAIGDGIEAATAELTSIRAIAGHEKMQVVLSDGYYNWGTNPVVAANAADAAGITIHTVGVPGHDATMMENIADATGGVYTSVSDLTTLEGLFDGTGGNLVNLDHVDIQLADGTWIYDIATDGLGNFILPDQVIILGANTFLAHAVGTDGTVDEEILTLYGTTSGTDPVPEPATLILMGTGLLGMTGIRRKKNKK